MVRAVRIPFAIRVIASGSPTNRCLKSAGNSRADLAIADRHVDGAGADAEIRLHGGALAGSGCAVKGAHIVDPRTGQGRARSGRVWAWAQTAAVADALSTAFFVMPWEEVQALCERTSGIGAASIDREDSTGATLHICGSFPKLTR